MRRFRFAGAAAIVTGAASGIGAALATGPVRRGSDVVLLDRDAARLDAVVADRGRVRTLGDELGHRLGSRSRTGCCRCSAATRSDSLRAELAPDIGVTVAHPGGITARIAEDAALGSGPSDGEPDATPRVAMGLLTIPPERAAEAILQGVERRRPRVLVGASAVLPDPKESHA